MSFAFPERERARPIWLITLADLALLLVGFFVLLQASRNKEVLARGLREGFSAQRAAAPPMPLAASGLDGFAPGSAIPPRSPEAVIAWARDAGRDPRVSFTITGHAAADEGLRLGFERAGALAGALIEAHAVTPDRIVLRATISGRRAAIATLGFSGPNR